MLKRSLEKKTAPKKWRAIRKKLGGIDDIAISGDLFRLEKMDTGSWWCCMYDGTNKRTAFSICLSNDHNDIEVKVIEDSIGCKDDSA